jgi:hypothetical protein
VANALTDFFGEMIADIRQKVVEQGWFGRTITPPHEPAKDEPSSGLGWVDWRDAEPPTSEIAPTDRGYDIDR